MPCLKTSFERPKGTGHSPALMIVINIKTIKGLLRAHLYASNQLACNLQSFAFQF